jgi:hydroxypyruvate isomerase
VQTDIRWVANISLLFTECPLLERAARAAAAGFDHVEVWWPFGANPSPSSQEIDAFVASIKASGVHLAAMNLWGGPDGERGVVSHPDQTAAFRDSVTTAMVIAEQLDTRLFNAAYGHRRGDLLSALQDATAMKNLAFAAEAALRVDGIVMVEPLSDATGTMPNYPLRTATDAAHVIDRVKRQTGATVKMLFDQYHLGVNGDDVLAAVEKYIDMIAHVQLADIPGRGEPGSGSANIENVVSTLLRLGYAGAFSLEYLPTTDTATSLEATKREQTRWANHPRT